MNFLTKIEEAINQLILRLLAKLKSITPSFIFLIWDFIIHFPQFLKARYKQLQPKMRIWLLKFIGYTDHYLTLFRGTFTGAFIYFRSEEFKKADKVKLLLTPFHFTKTNPAKAATRALIFGFFALSSVIIYQNVSKIAVAAYALRKPASRAMAEEDVFIVFKRQAFEVKVPGATHGEFHEQKLYLDVTLEAKDPKERAYLESMQEMLEESLEDVDLKVESLPLSEENKKILEETMLYSINEDFREIGHDKPLKKIVLKQVLPGRPKYYRQAERLLNVEDMNLQIFLEDTKRNRQVWLDFSVLASNRNVIMYLKEHEVEFKDHLTTNVEPVIPQLPVEEEGRQIIKDKIKLELNLFLEKKGIEGKVLEIYIDYLLAS